MYRIEELRVKELMEKIAQPVFPGPASGSAVAVGAAMGASLLEMSWRATLKKDPQTPNGDANLERMKSGGETLLELATKDMEGYNVYVKSASLKKTDPAAYDEALLTGTTPLVDIAMESLALLELLDQVQPDCFVKVQGDLAGSGTLLHGAVQAAVVATRINLGLMVYGDYPGKVGKQLAEAEEKASRFYEKIMNRVKGMLPDRRK
ncbi:cyclodeaminase/cyclohydrolase family protein [Alkalibacter rhizosphaerae]|uniref:Cyclodeaminase/cyclohydrolase family protein n=1 Tax=Alkalibacter rhizosphaerae TaxID=2815577 RepID=A0A974XDQ4_9FIRM|nr:cyclodeaminase/cyclohydrolase family protein [Alkalibacter rhizosphaerae]QSX07841.1 cyclodeaminase/cyclohydrolase family protein [Alkalibacter rhizosphaerae]